MIPKPATYVPSWGWDLTMPFSIFMYIFIEKHVIKKWSDKVNISKMVSVKKYLFKKKENLNLYLCFFTSRLKKSATFYKYEIDGRAGSSRL